MFRAMLACTQRGDHLPHGCELLADTRSPSILYGGLYCRWFHPDPELARREKRRKEIQELYLKDQDAAHKELEKFIEENDQEKTKHGPPSPPATRVQWRELPSGIGALKTVELIGADTRRYDIRNAIARVFVQVYCVSQTSLHIYMTQLCRGSV
jgi:hypothetical protein